MSNYWGQIRCVAHSPLIVGITIAWLNLSGTCIVWLQCVRLHFACTERLFNVSPVVNISVHMASPYVRCAIFPLKIKLILFFYFCVERFLFLMSFKNQFNILQETPLALEGLSHDTNVSIPLYGRKMMKAVTNVLNEKRAAMFRKLILRSRNGIFCCLVVMGHIGSSKNELLLRKRRTLSIFEDIPPQIRNKHAPPWARKGKNPSTYGLTVSTPHLLILFAKSSNPFSFYTLSVYSKATWLPKRRYWRVSQLWTRFNYRDCRRSRPRNDKKLPRNSTGSLEIVVVSKTRFSEQPPSAISNYPQQGRDNGDEGRCTSELRCSRKGHQRVSLVWSGGYRVSLAASWLEHGHSLPTKHRYTLFSIQILTILRWIQWLNSRFSLTKRRTMRNLLLFQELQCPKDQSNPCIYEKLPIRNENWKCSILCFQKFVWLI